MALPFILAAKVLGGGALFAAGNDMYHKGRDMLARHGPAALGAMTPDPGFMSKVTDVLDPLDLFGAKRRREEAAAAAAAAHEEQALRKLSDKEKRKRAAEAKRAAKKLSALQKQLNAAIAKGGKAEAAARAAMADIAALKRFAAHAKAQPEGHPAAELLAQVVEAVAEGAHPPDEQLYATQPGYDPGAYPETEGLEENPEEALAGMLGGHLFDEGDDIEEAEDASGYASLLW